jgi:hypothetical protein
LSESIEAAMVARRDGGRGDWREGGSASAIKAMGDGRTAACGVEDDEEDAEKDDDVIEDEEDDGEAAELREAIAEAADCWCCARKVARASL